MTDAACFLPHLCPLCQAPNACALATADAAGAAAAGADAPCWCAAVPFDAALLARLPKAARGTACICRACATAAAPDTTPAVGSGG